jgi:phosphoglycerate dehydrogenase-like enzyme
MPDRLLTASHLSEVVTEGTHEMLTMDRIRAAGLNVMVEEPPAPEHPLFSLQNVVLTPHMAGPGWENWHKAFRNCFDDVERVARDEKPLWVIPELRG